MDIPKSPKTVDNSLVTFFTEESWVKRVQDLYPTATFFRDSNQIYSAVFNSVIVAQWNNIDKLGWSFLKFPKPHSSVEG